MFESPNCARITTCTAKLYELMSSRFTAGRPPVARNVGEVPAEVVDAPLRIASAAGECSSAAGRRHLFVFIRCFFVCWMNLDPELAVQEHSRSKAK